MDNEGVHASRTKLCVCKHPCSMLDGNAMLRLTLAIRNRSRRCQPVNLDGIAGEHDASPSLYYE